MLSNTYVGYIIHEHASITIAQGKLHCERRVGPNNQSMIRYSEAYKRFPVIIQILVRFY